MTTVAFQGQGGGLDSNLGWKGAEIYRHGSPSLRFRADPQERYDIFMNNFTETTWMGPLMGQELEKVMKSFVQYPPRKLQSDGYTGPITISGYEKFESIKKQLQNYKIDINTGQ